VPNALVPIAPKAQDKDAADDALRLGTSANAGRADAGFVAQLIATQVQAPQTRARRRAEPEQAVAAYRALGQWPSAEALPGMGLSRSL
jgi:hypothetical protein